ncbi:MAG: S8 family serine peptidase, partial [Gemmobacter sp.]
GIPLRRRPRRNRHVLAMKRERVLTLDLFILSGVLRILRWADRWPRFPGAPLDDVVRAPVVINISYGIQAGSKDGSGFLEAEIARLVGLRNAAGIPTAVVLPSGNAYRTQCHAEMRVPQEETDAVTLRVQPEDLSVSFIEISLDDLTEARLTITPPVGPAGIIVLKPEAQVVDWRRYRTDACGQEVSKTIGRIYVRLFPETNKHAARTRVIFALCPTLNHDDPTMTAPPGPYGITLQNRCAEPLVARLDVQRDDSLNDFPRYGRQAYLDHEAVNCVDLETLMQNLPCADLGPVSRNGTLSALATATEANVIVVGSAFDRDARAIAALESGSGPNGARPGPDLGAIGTETRAHPGRLAAGTFSGGTSVFDGTSAAAPLVTRAIVDLWSRELPADGTVDIAALAGALAPVDPRLGSGVLAYAPSPGRPERRLRE